MIEEETKGDKNPGEIKEKVGVHLIGRYVELHFETQDFKIEIKMEKRKGGKTE